jgi:uncharacterized protein (DUF2235 family)
MGRNLLVFSDGTGNSGGKTRGTNVWRLHNLIERHHPTHPQLTFYDDGVGTQDLSLLRVIGGVFGWGLSENICACYDWLARNYREGDRIALFGFSRGAFTVRCLAGMVHACGLLDPAGLTPNERRKRVKKLLWAYRAADAPEQGKYFASWLRGEARVSERHDGEAWPAELREVRVHFTGVWDTVDAVGVPVDELRDLIDPLWQRLLHRRAYGFRNSRLRGVTHARQALAIDDERRTFHPNVWKRETHDATQDEDGPPETLVQVWFAGAHSNVGGGYPKDGLAHVTLDWMMGELQGVYGDEIVFTHDARQSMWDAANLAGRLYDSRTGIAAFYRYAPRRVAEFHAEGDQPRIHVSVFRRIDRASQGYAPLFLPENAQIAYTAHKGPFARETDPDGRDNVSRMGSLAAGSLVRAELARLVAWRARCYAGFAGLSILAIVAGLWTGGPVADSPGAKFLKGLIPDLTHRLVDAAWAHWPIAILVVLIASICGALGLRQRARIRELAGSAYDRALPDETPRAGSPG